MNVQIEDAQGNVLLQLPLAQFGGIPRIGDQIVVNHNNNAVTMTVQNVLWNPPQGIIRVVVA